MRELLKRVATNALSLFLVSLLFSGLTITGGFVNFLIAGALLAVFSTVLDPIVKFITLPFNILTLGLLSFLTSLVSLFVLTFVYKNVVVTDFTFERISFLGVRTSEAFISGILSYIVISATIYFLGKLINWIFS